MSWQENVNRDLYNAANREPNLTKRWQMQVQAGVPDSEIRKWIIDEQNGRHSSPAPAPPKNYVSSDSLAQNQLDNIIGKNAPLTRRSKAQGLEYAASRGALNSDQGAEATWGAMVDRAAPIATADANVYAQHDLLAQRGDIEKSLQYQRGDIEKSLQYGQNIAMMGNSLINGMLGVMRTPDAVWTQTMQNDVEGVINSFKPWASGVYSIPLAGSLSVR